MKRAVLRKLQPDPGKGVRIVDKVRRVILMMLASGLASRSVSYMRDFMLCRLCTRSADHILYKYHELDRGSIKLSECSNPPRHRHLRMNTSASKVLIA